MERAVIGGIRGIVSDRGALASTLKACGFAAAELKQAIEAVDGQVKSLGQVETTEDTGTLIERVELRREACRSRSIFAGCSRPTDSSLAELVFGCPSCPPADETAWRRDASGAPV